MQEPDNQDPIARLLRQAGRRPQPSAEALVRIREKVHAEWAAGVQRRQRNRWMAMAAALGVLALAAVLFVGMRGHEQPVVAQVETGNRGVQQGERLDVAPGKGLVLHTEAGHATIRVAGGSSIQFEAPEQLRLLSGSVYVDALIEADAVVPRLVVLADRAAVEHIGTQFLVRKDDERVDVAVRSGSVELRTPKASATLARGETGRIDSAGQEIQKGTIPTSGEQWAWADALVPPLAIEGLSLLEALTRLSREAGYEMSFDSPEIERSARETVLHGPAMSLPPGRALQVLLATTDFEAVFPPEGSRMLVRMR